MKPFATARRASDLYATARWKQASLEHRQREPYCRLCREQGRNRMAESVDHINRDKDFWDERNWQSLCAECHNSKTARDVAARMSKRREAEPHPGLVG